jgi:hypothetical protein
MVTAILVSTLVWFFSAMILFFNPIVGKMYQSEEDHPSVKNLPKNPLTMGKIMLAVLVQCILWALVYNYVKASLPSTLEAKTLVFGSIILVMKMIPRDIDRLLLTTYPIKRLTIEFVIGGICAYLVAFVFTYFL